MQVYSTVSAASVRFPSSHALARFLSTRLIKLLSYIVNLRLKLTVYCTVRERVKFRVARLVRQSLSGSGHLSTWQMTAASCPTALGALCGQLTF